MYHTNYLLISTQRQSRSRSAFGSTQSRGAHTAAAPPFSNSTARTPPGVATTQAQPKQPGMLAQMAATAGSVAIGSTIGHGLSNMIFGAGRDPQQVPVQHQQDQSQNGLSCDIQAKGDQVK